MSIVPSSSSLAATPVQPRPKINGHLVKTAASSSDVLRLCVVKCEFGVDALSHGAGSRGLRRSSS